MQRSYYSAGITSKRSTKGCCFLPFEWVTGPLCVGGGGGGGSSHKHTQSCKKITVIIEDGYQFLLVLQRSLILI